VVFGAGYLMKAQLPMDVRGDGGAGRDGGDG
jgi:hypothetical protein